MIPIFSRKYANLILDRGLVRISTICSSVGIYSSFTSPSWTLSRIYVQNRSPHRILKDMTPKEAFSSKKPNIENLRIFGCPVYSHIPKDKRNKLEPLVKKGIFVGYSDSSKAYRIDLSKG